MKIEGNSSPFLEGLKNNHSKLMSLLGADIADNQILQSMQEIERVFPNVWFNLRQEQYAYRSRDDYSHTIRMLGNLDTSILTDPGSKPIVRSAVIWHDTGKPQEWFHGGIHNRHSADLMRRYFKDLGVERSFIDQVYRQVLHHDVLGRAVQGEYRISRISGIFKTREELRTHYVLAKADISEAVDGDRSILAKLHMIYQNVLTQYD